MPKYAKHPIKGYEDLYWITKQGRVFNKERELKLPINKQGYVSITLTKDGVPKGWRVHRLMLLTFVPNPENKPQCNHKNSIRHDNHLTNLEWCTPAENAAHGAIATRARRAKQHEKLMKLMDKAHKKYVREHPDEFDENGRRIYPSGLGRGFGSLLVPQRQITYSTKPARARIRGLGLGFGSLIPQSTSNLPDVSKKSVDSM
jgi:hypothetical protein